LIITSADVVEVDTVTSVMTLGNDVVAFELIEQSLKEKNTQKKLASSIKLSLSKTVALVGKFGPDTSWTTRTDLEHVFMFFEYPTETFTGVVRFCKGTYIIAKNNSEVK